MNVLNRLEEWLNEIDYNMRKNNNPPNGSIRYNDMLVIKERLKKIISESQLENESEHSI